MSSAQLCEWAYAWFLDNGWAGEMFSGQRPRDVTTTCGAGLDQTTVNYSAVRANTLDQGIEYLFNQVQAWLTGAVPIDIYPWNASDMYPDPSDRFAPRWGRIGWSV
ncbi:MAG TPA: hypothetical protein VHM70_06645 [Polyangiaceae bacterium]|nr:hypothetical protein [Polyangiaceae bacterium]